MTPDEFHRQLTGLLRTAAANNIDVRGGWFCESSPTRTADWDIEIVEIARNR
jgi:hypothetical protein